MESKEEAVVAKKPYVRPKIIKVKLLAEEAILTGCKVTDGGPTQKGAASCDHTSHAPCSTTGS